MFFSNDGHMVDNCAKISLPVVTSESFTMIAYLGQHIGCRDDDMKSPNEVIQRIEVFYSERRNSLVRTDQSSSRFSYYKKDKQISVKNYPSRCVLFQQALDISVQNRDPY